MLQKTALAFIANQINTNDEMRKIREEFYKIDTNQDGVISREELCVCKLICLTC